MFKLFQSSGIDFLRLHKKTKWDWLLSRRQKSERKLWNYLRFFGYGFLIIAVASVLFLALNIVRIRMIYLNGMLGKVEVTQAIAKFKAKDYKTSGELAMKASDHFDKAKNDFDKINDSFFIKNTPFVSSQFDYAGNLIATAEILSRSLSQGSNFAYEINSLVSGEKSGSYSKFTIEERRSILNKIQKSSPELVGMKANLDLALNSLEQVKCSGLFILFCDKIKELREKVLFGSTMIGKAIPLSQMLPAFAGYPATSTFLVLLQNQDELRPTGGFLGTYGILEVNSGEISRFDTHDIYHMDMPIKDKLSIRPPEPIAKYLNTDKWYMRDSNWSPDWPISARTIEDFYHKENSLLTGVNQVNNFSGQFTGVMAITPKFITDLLKITGPIAIEGQEYNQDNFTDLLEYRVEKGYVEVGESSWQRKEVIGEIAKEIKIRLLDMPSDRWKEIVTLLDDNLLQKDAMIYLHDKELQLLAREEGWTGEMKAYQGDYLMLVDANLAAYKTDAVIDRGLVYTIREKGGDLLSEITASYSHQGGFDWRTTKYRTYSRLYVPSGSQLVSSEGQEGKVDIGEENGKTYFGAFITVDPGQINAWHVEYRLPARLSENLKGGDYSLLIQKQPGKIMDDLRVNLNFLKDMKTYAPTGFNVEKGSDKTISWRNDLSVDRYYKVNF